MQTECPLCESNNLRKHGKTADGLTKYCCEVCSCHFIDGADINVWKPKINLLSFKEQLLVIDTSVQLEYQASNFLKLADREVKKLRKVYFLFRTRNYYIKNIFDYLLYLIPNIFNKINKQKSYRWGIVGFWVAILIYSFMCIYLKINVNEHQPYDSYTLQALAWRSGHLELPQDYNWLELAKYQGKYYLSFPPVPTIPMLFLTFFFGEKTPSNWLMIVCFFSSYWIAYKLIRRLQNSDFESAVWAVFLICGSSYLDISLFGWVWYMAQSMSFVLTLSCLLCLTYPSRKIQGWGLFCFALAVGCRPLQAVYTPIILGLIYRMNRKNTILNTIQGVIPMLIGASLVVLVLGILNYLRFNSILEFGHNHLPVLIAEPQFSLSYIPRNFLRLTTVFPTINSSWQLDLPRFGGFAFYIANPIFIILGLRLITRWTMDKIDWLIFISILFHFFVLMMHITFGAWQFGTRFLVDLFPAVIVLCTRNKQPLKLYEMLIIIFGLTFNIYGGIVFRTPT